MLVKVKLCKKKLIQLRDLQRYLQTQTDAIYLGRQFEQLECWYLVDPGWNFHATADGTDEKRKTTDIFESDQATAGGTGEKSKTYKTFRILQCYYWRNCWKYSNFKIKIKTTHLFGK